MTFYFGAASEHVLLGVTLPLRLVTHSAIVNSNVDFCAYEGLRTYAQEHENVRKGTSTTMNSMHLPQKPDLLSHAVDLVPWIGGRPVWDWDACYEIAAAMWRAAKAQNCLAKVRWGGVWDKRLSDATAGTAAEFKALNQNYIARRKAQNQRAFIDGPHFEWRD